MRAKFNIHCPGIYGLSTPMYNMYTVHVHVYIHVYVCTCKLHSVHAIYVVHVYTCAYIVYSKYTLYIRCIRETCKTNTYKATHHSQGTYNQHCVMTLCNGSFLQRWTRCSRRDRDCETSSGEHSQLTAVS